MSRHSSATGPTRRLRLARSGILVRLILPLGVILLGLLAADPGLALAQTATAPAGSPSPTAPATATVTAGATATFAATSTPPPATTPPTATPPPPATNTPSPSYSPTLYLSPTSGVPGNTITINGYGYALNEGVAVYVNGSQICGCTAGGNGAFNASFTIPNVSAGTYNVTATGNSSGASTSAPFTVNGLTPGLSLNVGQGLPGTSVTATGSGFYPNETVTLSLGGTQVGSLQASGGGSFTDTFNVPSISTGNYQVIATGQSSGASISQPFTVGSIALTLSANQITAGSALTVSGSGYQAGETVQVNLNGASVGSVTANSSGGFSLTFNVPSLGPGAYALTASGQTSGAAGAATLTVVAGATPVPAPSATAVPTPAPTSAPQPAPPLIHDERYFAQTGYRIDNDAIWTYFQSRGQVAIFGYPTSRTFQLLGCQVQMFQRQIAQVCTGQGATLMNILDQTIFPYTHVNGSTFPAPYPSVQGSTPPTSDPNYAADIIAFVQQTAPNTFNGQPVNFGNTFFNTVTPDQAGVSDPNLLTLIDLEVWGAPISQPAADPTNPNFIYQRFQRGIMHYDATAGVTQGILISDYLKDLILNQNIPTDLAQEAQGSRFLNQYCPGAAGWICNPSVLPGTDFTNAFQPG